MPLPPRQGLYDPANEHDACGLGFVAELRKNPSHDVVTKALEILTRLSHRGAAGSDPTTGDGAGILLQIPHEYFERVTSRAGMELPLAGDYGVAMVFLSRDREVRRAHMRALEDATRYHNQRVIGWRDVPVNSDVLGHIGRDTMPVIRQLFIGRMCPLHAFERTLFMIRKRAGRLSGPDFYAASCSSATIVYKGLALPERLDQFFLDLQEDDVRASIAVVHSRFSTNTFPTWERAHPYRRICHNGEINTLRGNMNWMHAREALLSSEVFGEHIAEFKPIIRQGGSDSASLDNVVDFLVAGGRSLPHVMMMLVPEAWASNPDMPADKRAFYEYHEALVQPWDGPAALVFTDGSLVGATLDRNGLRPAKYVVTQSGLVAMASEFGVLDFEPEDVIEKGRLQPGKMFLVDTREGRIVSDDEIKSQVARRKPYGEWVADNKIELEKLPPSFAPEGLSFEERNVLRRAFGYSREDEQILLAAMAEKGEEPTGSMGTDIPLAVLSRKNPLLFRYFKQQFAQVTNPPIDPIREELVMSLVSCVGSEGNLLAETPKQCRQLELPHPILSNADLAKVKANELEDLRVAIIPLLFPIAGDGLAAAVDELVRRASRAVDEGASVLVLSDRGVNAEYAPIPSLLGVAAVHHSLIRAAKRTRCGIIVESGEPREVADMALLIGYGASALNPYMAFELIFELAKTSSLESVRDPKTAEKNYIKAINKGLLKILSKMGISTLSSYHGAQIFEAIGIGKGVVERYFTGTASVLDGIGLAEIQDETLARHSTGAGVGGVYAWRATGEAHLWNPTTIASLQKAVREEDRAAYAQYAANVNEQNAQPMTLRGLWDFVPQAPAVPLEEVESAQEIVKRFCTGAMSFGSISKEAHENLAVAMNRMGGKSNTGEGGEDPSRFVRLPNGDSKRSAIKQVASARFGVTTHYLVNADELQIKIAQGAKPGEGGQLPGHKVDEVIARTRHSTPGVTLISPPPHHDIYSIEDLAQLIFDLKSVNASARISVKLVSESGVGTIAAGVAKAHADGITIAGHDGGTGASPLSSIQHAGAPWEIGLAETQQVLVLNHLRGRVRLQVDGQLKTGRDVAIGALLGADEFGFATAPLVASGCVMMRKCHLNTCPVGIATQDPVLRERFRGEPEHVIRYFFFVAEELRSIMAKLGFRTLSEMIGRTDCLAVREDIEHPKARLLDFSNLLRKPDSAAILRHSESQEHGLEDVLDRKLVEAARVSIKYGEPSRITGLRIANKDRAFGAMLAGELARVHGGEGLPKGTVTIEVTGTAGQSFGAFAVCGTKIVLEGDANDYVGKGLSGGTLVVRPPSRARFVASENVIVGNTVLYGATSGEAFFCGRAGERFAVRNSGARTVVEGIGDHGCEYMTGGIVVVLGPTGRNFGAGMSGGLAFVLDEVGDFSRRCNRAMIELEKPEAEDDVLLRELVHAHLEHTGSERAKGILARWEHFHRCWVKVMPTEYQRILRTQKAS